MIVPPHALLEDRADVRKLGLLDDWLRERFHGLGILEYEDLDASDTAAFAAEPARAALR